jgi:hypothetical protein
MLEAVVGVIVGLLIVGGVLIILGPNLAPAWRRLKSAGRPVKVPSAFQMTKSRDVVPPGLNPKTQRVVIAAARLASWLRAHGQEDVAREIRTAAARMTANEPSGLYALQIALRRIRVVNIHDRLAQERLTALAKELHGAVQDRFEQLELLPFRKP